MKKYHSLLADTLRRKGFFESIVYGCSKATDLILSRIRILFLHIRGYDIDASVIVKGDNFFFQSVQHSVHISKGTVIGKHTRISCGGNGKISIGENVLIDDYVYIMSHESIVIGDNTKIAAFTFITDFNHNYADKRTPLVKQGYNTKPVRVGEHVWIGTHTILLPGITVGDRVVIGAGSVISHNIASGSVVVGNPSRVIKNI